MAEQCPYHDDIVRIQGGLEANVGTVLKGQQILFEELRKLTAIVTTNQNDVKHLVDLYGNGWKRNIELQISETCDELTGCIKAVDDRVKGLEGDAWFPHLMTSVRNKWFSRSLLIFIVVTAIAVVNFAVSMFGHAYLSRNLPNIMKIIGG